ncbi:hypothetical protein WJX72_004976 [[Myrmecia] bisecta]|uniref:Uncharacterized protein n=1 Tax=[Myrmecia] bisecta TaxID=41462 RepID=A0AAW1Q5L5_9CHLO
MDASVLSLEELMQETPHCYLQPKAFFVSWQGVLTLAFRGFPTALITLKAALQRHHPALATENSGSKWPKTTLGAIKDKKRLMPEQLTKLMAVCAEESACFAAAEEIAGLQVRVDKAAIAMYECRSLERLLSLNEVRFSAAEDTSLPSPEEQQRVQTILDEAAEPDYWFAASRDGNRELHYRGPALGVTLAHFLGAHSSASSRSSHTNGTAGSSSSSSICGQKAGAQALIRVIDRFRRRVEAELPGMYCWFPDQVLHVTLRALVG